LVSDISWVGVTELRIAADLFAKKGIQLSWIERVSGLVRSAKQARLGVGLLVVSILRNGEPGRHYCTPDSIRIDERVIGKTFADGNLRALDVQRREQGIRAPRSKETIFPVVSIT